MPSGRERALRQLVVRLAEAQESDRNLILDQLSAEQTEEVSRLLVAYRGALADPVARPSEWSGLGLSPAMIQRLDGGGLDLPAPLHGGRSVELRALALETLRRCARDLEPVTPPPPPPPPPGSPRPGLLARLGLWRAGR